MPVVINEILITAVVAEQQKQTNATPVGNNSSAQRDGIVQLCVEEVMRILKEKTAR